MRRALLLLALLLLVAGPVFAQKVLSVENADDDPEKEYVFENRFFRLVMKASLSGSGMSLTIPAKGTEMLMPLPGQGQALVADAIWQQGMAGDWRGAYDAVIDTDTAEQAAVTFSRRGSTGNVLKWVTIRRSITVRADSPVIRVAVRVENEAAAMQPFTLGYWAHQQVGAAGQDNSYFVPTARGVRRLLISGASSTQEYWDYEPSAGWLAAIAEDGSGLAFRMDYSRLMGYYQWLKGSMKTVEWLYRSVEIPNGGAFQTEYQVIALRGLPYLDGVGDAVVGAFMFDQVAQPGQATPAHVALLGDGGDAQVEVVWRRLPAEAWSPLHRGAVRMESGEVARVPFQVHPPEDGTYVLRATVTRGGKQAAVIERPLNLGASSGAYALAPECPRVGDPKERYEITLEGPAAAAKAGVKAAPKTELREVPPDISYELGVWSPHVAWARPYHLGKTRAYVLTQAQSAREVIEVAQRVDLDLKTTTFGAASWKLPGDLVRGWNDTAAMMNMRQVLTKEPLDVLVVRAPWTAFSPEIRALLVQRVEQGIGLVYVSYDYKDDAPELFEFVGQGQYGKGQGQTYTGKPDAPWEVVTPHYVGGSLPYEHVLTPVFSFEQKGGLPLVAWRAGKDRVPLVVANQRGKGRIVLVNYNPVWFPTRGDMFTPHFHYRPYERLRVPDYEQSWPTHHFREYAFALLTRCILWAAGREPQVQVREARAAVEGDRGTLTLSLHNEGAAGNLACEVLVRDDHSRLLHRSVSIVQVAVGDGAVQASFDASALKAGDSFVDFRLLNDRGVVEFGATALSRPALKLDIKLKKDPVLVGDEAVAAVATQDPMPAGAECVLTVEDHHRRVLYEAPVTLKDGKAEVPLKLDRLETPGFWVRAAAVQDGRVLGEKEYRGLKQMPVVFDDWLLGVETYSGTAASWRDAYHREFRRQGYRLAHTQVRYEHAVASMRNEGMLAGDITGLMRDFEMKDYQEVKAQFAKTGDKKWLARNPCLNDPKYRQKVAADIAMFGPILRAYGIWDHTITDEFSLTVFGDAYDFCFCQHCLGKFREWVKPQYRDLAELCDSYGAQFKTWDEVLPSTFAEAQERDKFAGWADHRRFMELSVYDYFDWVRREVRVKTDPTARISLSGTQIPHPFNGHDVWLRCKTFDGLWSYPGQGQVEMHREWGRRGKPDWYEFPWRGYAGRGPGQDFAYWSMALNQTTGAAYWWFLGVLNPDWRLSDTGAWTEKATRDLREGLGQLILSTDLLVAPVALHYSQASTRGSYARRAFQNWESTRSGWMGVLEALNLQFGFLSYEQVETGKLAFPQTRALILPYSICLSDKEAQAIRGFVEAGGVVIADLQTGVMDEHCRVRTRGALDDVFGIRRMDTRADFVGGEPKLTPPADWKLANADLRVTLAEPGLALDGGQALIHGAAAPGVVVHRFGKGWACYLNFALTKVGAMVDRNEHGALLALVGKLMDDAGVRPPFRVARRDGQPVVKLGVFAYANGEQRYLGLLPRGGDKQTETMPLRVTLDAPRFVREVRSGKSVGRCEAFDVDLASPYTQFFAMLPAETASLEASVTPKVEQGGAARLEFEVKSADGKPGMRVVRVTVKDPSGQDVLRYERNVRCAEGRGQVDLAFALNDPAGAYAVNLRDIASGLAKALTVEVTPVKRRIPAPDLPDYPPVDPAKGKDLWQGDARPRPEWKPMATEDKPMDLTRGLLKNPRLWEKDERTRGPKDWHVSKTVEGKYLPPDQAVEHVRLVKDDEIKFRGEATTRIEVQAPVGLWTLQQILPAEKVAGKKLKVTYHALRTSGPEVAGSSDAILRLRPWKEGRVHGEFADAQVSCPLNVWMTAKCELRVRPDIERLDVQIFGKTTETLRLSGVLIEAED